MASRNETDVKKETDEGRDDFLDMEDAASVKPAPKPSKALEGVIIELDIRPPSVPLINPKHEQFCVLRANGVGQAAAYRQVYKAKWVDKPAHDLGNKASIRLRIQYLQERAGLEFGIDNQWVMTEAVKLVLEADFIEDVAKKVQIKGKALMDLAKLKGMTQDKAELSADGVIAWISDHYSDRSHEQQVEMRSTLAGLFGPNAAKGMIIQAREGSKPAK